MKNTLDNKRKFFALYFGQELLSWKDKLVKRLCKVEEISEIDIREDFEFYFLKLTPLSKISDEDAIKCWENDNYIPSENDVKNVERLFTEMSAINSDYLRSKGYALPWMGLTVEEIIDYGWVELKTE